MFFTNNVLSFFHLLRACSSNKVPQLVFTSSTSLYGASVQRPQGRAVWYHESSPVTCCDLYDCTKLLAEQLCESLAQKESIGVTVLRVARFFVEEEISFNLCKLFRTVDLRDVVRAHTAAVRTATAPGYRVFNVAAKSPFCEAEADELFHDPMHVIERYYPGAERLFAQRQWPRLSSIDRIYDIGKAERELAYRPAFGFEAFFHASKRSPGERITLASLAGESMERQMGGDLG